MALADTAIELIHTGVILTFIGYEAPGPIEAFTDNKAAYDLCHRFTSAQNSRHIDRKLFKMRELRGAGQVTVAHIPTDQNPADLYTKILSWQPFEKHRKTVLNLAGDTGLEHGRKSVVTDDASPRWMSAYRPMSCCVAGSLCSHTAVPIVRVRLLWPCGYEPERHSADAFSGSTYVWVLDI